jgi:serine O-acetyltransferase
MPEAGELYLMPKRENNWHLNNVVDELRRVRQAWRDEHAKNNYRNKRSLPSRESVNSADTLIKVLYPMRLGDVELRKEGEDYYVGHLLGTSLDRLTEEAFWNSYYQSDEQSESHAVAGGGQAGSAVCQPFAGSASVSIAIFSRRIREIPPRAAWMRCCSAIREFMP